MIVPNANTSTPHINTIYGNVIDSHTRCVHYHSENDIIAIKFKCCNRYYSCHSCHKETADHPAQVWPKEEWDQRAILCGECGYEMTISEYRSSKDQCPSCKALFNPNCSLHYHLYFED